MMLIKLGLLENIKNLSHCCFGVGKTILSFPKITISDKLKFRQSNLEYLHSYLYFLCLTILHFFAFSQLQSILK